MFSWLPKPSGTNIKYNVITNSETGRITIKQNGLTVVDLCDTTYTSGTYDVLGNNCKQKKSIYISSFSTKVDKETFIHK